MTQLELLALRGPQFSGQAATFQQLLDLAANQTSRKFFGVNYDLAVVLRVLHWLTLQGRGGAGGPVTAEREGDLARSFASPQAFGDLDSTSYGLELRTLTKNCGGLTARNQMVCP